MPKEAGRVCFLLVLLSSILCVRGRVLLLVNAESKAGRVRDACLPLHGSFALSAGGHRCFVPLHLVRVEEAASLEPRCAYCGNWKRQITVAMVMDKCIVQMFTSMFCFCRPGRTFEPNSRQITYVKVEPAWGMSNPSLLINFVKPVQSAN
jgi:hypothetical protein